MQAVFIDSDIFVRDLRYPRDQRSAVNRQFLKRVHAKRIRGVTSIFNLLEICGILAYNLSPAQLVDLYSDFCQHYNVTVLFPADAQGDLQYDIPRIFQQIQTRQSLGDAQISYVVNRFANDLSRFVSWNASHFEEKLPIPACTPQQLMAAR